MIPNITLKAVILDINRTEESYIRDAGKMEEELDIYRILKITDFEQSRYWEKKYIYIKKTLEHSGVPASGALLITEDEKLAAYVMQMEPEGMAVVFYETTGISANTMADIIVQGFAEIDVRFLDRVQKRKQGLPWDILYTERTYVKEISLNDLKELYELYAGEGITDYTEPLFVWAEEEEYTRGYITYMYRYYGYGMWIVRDRLTDKLIGRAGIEHREMDGRVHMELGYIIDCNYQNKGYATEVCQAILDYAKEELKIENMNCFIHPDNHASVRVAEKLGFSYTGTRNENESILLHYEKKL